MFPHTSPIYRTHCHRRRLDFTVPSFTSRTAYFAPGSRLVGHPKPSPFSYSSRRSYFDRTPAGEFAGCLFLFPPRAPRSEQRFHFRDCHISLQYSSIDGIFRIIHFLQKRRNPPHYCTLETSEKSTRGLLYHKSIASQLPFVKQLPSTIYFLIAS